MDKVREVTLDCDELIEAVLTFVDMRGDRSEVKWLVDDNLSVKGCVVRESESEPQLPRVRQS